MRGDTRQCGLLNESGFCHPAISEGAIAASLASGGAKPAAVDTQYRISTRPGAAAIMSPAHDVRQYCALRKNFGYYQVTCQSEDPLRWRGHGSWTGNRPNGQKNNMMAHERNNPRFKNNTAKAVSSLRASGFSIRFIGLWSFDVKNIFLFSPLMRRL